MAHEVPIALPMQAPRVRVRDLVELTKPGITAMCLSMAAGGIGVAFALPGYISPDLGWSMIVAGVVGTALSVAGANALNMYAERDGDRHMRRTRNRPLPAGRMTPVAALVFGLVVSAASMAVLWWGTNPTATALAAFAILSYVLVYTPLKRRSPHALVVGAVPGAVPPLLGWAIATGEVGVPGVVLFTVLLIWQLPHFLAISIYRQRDYDDAGIRIVASVRGLTAAKHQSLVYSLLLVATSLLLVPLGMAGFLYFTAATAVGALLICFVATLYPSWRAAQVSPIDALRYD